MHPYNYSKNSLKLQYDAKHENGKRNYKKVDIKKNVYEAISWIYLKKTSIIKSQKKVVRNHRSYGQQVLKEL